MVAGIIFVSTVKWGFDKRTQQWIQSHGHAGRVNGPCHTPHSNVSWGQLICSCYLLMNSVNETRIILGKDGTLAVIRKYNVVRGGNSLFLRWIKFLYHRNLSLGKYGLHFKKRYLKYSICTSLEKLRHTCGGKECGDGRLIICPLSSRHTVSARFPVTYCVITNFTKSLFMTWLLSLLYCHVKCLLTLRKWQSSTKLFPASTFSP